MGLQVQTLTGGVGGNQDAHRVLMRGQVEGALDGLALLRRGRAVEDGDALLGAVGAGGGSAEHAEQVALGVLVFREDQQPCVLPAAVGSRGRLAG